MELDVGVDMLADPGSPTVSRPLTFPHMELPELLEPPALPSLLQPLTLFPFPKLSSSVVPQVCQ